MIRTPLATALTLAALALPAAASVQGEQKELAKACQQALKHFDQQLAARLALLQTSIAQVEQAAKQGNFDVSDFVPLAQAAGDFQQGVATDASAATGQVLGSAAGGLADLQGEALLDEVYPKGFGRGDGGSVDQVYSGLEKRLAKAYAKLGKRLRKTAKILEQEAHHSLTFVLRNPYQPWEARIAPSTVIATGDSALTIDLAFALSNQAVASDGFLFVHGSADDDYGAPSIVFAGPEVAPGNPAAIDGDFYRSSTGGFGFGVDEGCYLIHVEQVAGAPIASLALAVK